MFYMTTNYFRHSPHLFLGPQLGSGFIWNLLRPFSLDLGFASGCSSKLTFSSSGLGLLIMILQLTLRRYEGIVIRDKELIINEVRLTFFCKEDSSGKTIDQQSHDKRRGDGDPHLPGVPSARFFFQAASLPSFLHQARIICHRNSGGASVLMPF